MCYLFIYLDLFLVTLVIILRWLLFYTSYDFGYLLKMLIFDI